VRHDDAELRHLRHRADPAYVVERELDPFPSTDVDGLAALQDEALALADVDLFALGRDDEIVKGEVEGGKLRVLGLERIDADKPSSTARTIW